MISWNMDDDYIGTISRLVTEASGFQPSDEEDDEKYRVYGMKAERSYPAFLTVPDHMDATMRVVSDFLARNGIASWKAYEDGPVKIGLRRDVRKNTKAAAKLVWTIVGMFEGVVRVDPVYRIPDEFHPLRGSARTIVSSPTPSIFEIPPTPSWNTWIHQHQLPQ